METGKHCKCEETEPSGELLSDRPSRQLPSHHLPGLLSSHISRSKKQLTEAYVGNNTEEKTEEMAAGCNLIATRNCQTAFQINSPIPCSVRKCDSPEQVSSCFQWKWDNKSIEVTIFTLWPARVCCFCWGRLMLDGVNNQRDKHTVYYRIARCNVGWC